MEISEKVVVAVDSSKFNKASCMVLCGIEDIDCIVSDDKLSDEIMAELGKKNIEVVTP